MEWPNSKTSNADWRKDITNFDVKELIAKEMANRLKDGDVVGVGSGSTSLLTLRALAERARKNEWQFTAITTSLEMESFCVELRVRTSNLIQQRPDWSFDGADEIDGELNMIKGRGGAMLREKLVMASSPERYVVVDDSKRVERLGQKFPVPIEVMPEALNLVREQLSEFFDIQSMELRSAHAKDGPVITESGNVILDVKFAEVNPDLDLRLNSVPGAIGTGLFIGFNPTVVGA
ncbi:MAG TPA: ribose 5-phosphate isomerase A [Acidimicrobiales bacterium]|nr:ribose 5-phosphate isomerase A [Acidimicrobiales bacterium]